MLARSNRFFAPEIVDAKAQVPKIAFQVRLHFEQNDISEDRVVDFRIVQRCRSRFSTGSR